MLQCVVLTDITSVGHAIHSTLPGKVAACRFDTESPNFATQGEVELLSPTVNLVKLLSWIPYLTTVQIELQSWGS